MVFSDIAITLGGTSILKGQGCSLYLSGVKEAVLVFSLSVLSRKHVTGDNVLCKNRYLLGEKKL